MWNDSWFNIVYHKFNIIETSFFIVYNYLCAYVFTYILVCHSIIMPCFYLPFSNGTFFLSSTSLLPFSINVVLTLYNRPIFTFVTTDIRVNLIPVLNIIFYKHSKAYSVETFLQLPIGSPKHENLHNSNMSPAVVGNKIVDHSDEIGASHVGTAPTSSSFST